MRKLRTQRWNQFSGGDIPVPGHDVDPNTLIVLTCRVYAIWNLAFYWDATEEMLFSSRQETSVAMTTSRWSFAVGPRGTFKGPSPSRGEDSIELSTMTTFQLVRIKPDTRILML